MARGRIIDIVVRVNSTQAERALRGVGATATATAAEAERAFNRSQTALFRTGQAMSSVGRTMTGIGLGLAAVGYYSAKQAITFQTAMTRIQTQAGASRAQVDSLSAAVLKLGQSGQVQYGPTQLANALYHIESVAAGSYPQLRNTSNAMKVLKIAAQGAALGGSDLEQTTTALMGALFATRTPISQAGNLMGMLNATVGAGNMTMTDLVGALGRGVIPAFRQYGLKATDAAAALALFSDSGVKASSASAQVSTALHYLVQPSTKADKYLHFLHMTQYQMAQDLYKPHGFLVALHDLRNHLMALPGGATGWEAGQVLASIFPGGRGRIMLTVLQNLDRYKGKLDAIFATQGKFQKLADTQRHTMAGELHSAWAVIQSDVTLFGNTLLPIIAKDLPFFIRGLKDILKVFTGLPGPVKSFLGILTPALLIGGPLMMGLGAMITMLGRLRGAWQAVGLWARRAMVQEEAAVGVSALPGEAMGASAYWSRIRGTRAATAAEEGAGAAGAGRFGGLAGIAAMVAAMLGYNSLSRRHKKQVGNFVSNRLLGWTKPFGRGINDLFAGHPGAAAQQLWHSIASSMTFGLWGGAHGGLVTPRGIRRFQLGGPAGTGTDNIPAWLTAGEGVVNRLGMAGLGTSGLAQINSGGGFGQQPIYINIPVHLDGRQIAKSTLQHSLRKAARGPSSLVGGALQVGAAVAAR